MHNFHTMVIDDDDLLDCFIHLPQTEHVSFALNLKTIAEAQQRDAFLYDLAHNAPLMFQWKQLAPEVDELCCITDADQWQVCPPDKSLQPTIQWHHLSLCHVGQNWLVDMMNLFHPHLHNAAEEFARHCNVCQKLKNVGPAYAELGP